MPVGEYAYKYVVYVNDENERPVEYWSYDLNVSSRSDDDYGGFNSIVNVKPLLKFSETIRVILILIVISIFLYYVSDSVMRYILGRRLSLRRKLMVTALVLGLLSNLTYIFINVFHERKVYNDFYSQQLNLINLHLIGDRIDFANKDVFEQSLEIKKSLFDFLYFGSNIGEDASDNSSSSIETLCVFSPTFRLASYALKEESVDEMLENAKMYSSEQTIDDYLQNVVFHDIISLARSDLGKKKHILL